MPRELCLTINEEGKLIKVEPCDGKNPGINSDKVLACAPKGSDEDWKDYEKGGNYLEYSRSGVDGVLEVGGIKDTYCNPSLDECSCEGLFSYVLDDNNDVTHIVGSFGGGRKDSYTNIEGRLDGGRRDQSFACECFLKAAAQRGFRYIKLHTQKEICNDQREFGSKNYLTVCAKYEEEACSDLGKKLGRFKIGKNNS